MLLPDRYLSDLKEHQADRYTFSGQHLGQRRVEGGIFSGRIATFKLALHLRRRTTVANSAAIL